MKRGSSPAKKPKKKLPDYKQYIQMVDRGMNPATILGQRKGVIELKPVEVSPRLRA
jgi:hypothetical protein